MSDSGPVEKTNCQSGRVFGPNAFSSRSSDEQFGTLPLQPGLAVPTAPSAFKYGDVLSKKNVPDEDVNVKERKFATAKLNGVAPSVSVKTPVAFPEQPRVQVPCQSYIVLADAGVEPLTSAASSAVPSTAARQSAKALSSRANGHAQFRFS